jgi:hypothetical protein
LYPHEGKKMNDDNGSGLGASFFFALGFVLTFVGIVKWLELSSAQWGWQIWWIVWIWVGAFIMRAAFNKRLV